MRDMQGSFHCAQMRQAGVQLLSESLPGTSTGTVIVLTTPDANRTFLSYLGSSQTLTLSTSAEAAISRSRVLIVEGYLWEMPGAKEAIGSAVRLARDSGALVALTTGDSSLVARHRNEFLRLLDDGAVDVLFANRSVVPSVLSNHVTHRCDWPCNTRHLLNAEVITHTGNDLNKLMLHCRAEAAALLGHPVSAAEAASRLGSLCSLAAITDGANGSCISALGRLQVTTLHAVELQTAFVFKWQRGGLDDCCETIGSHAVCIMLQVVPPYWTAETPVDTCGAGDAYCAGLLYAYLSGMDPSAMGRCSARVASAVICRSGACLTAQEADNVVSSLPAVDSLRAQWAVAALEGRAATMTQ